ncbi:hypothetical protein FDB37_15775 [Clostridium botulinum]|nr:hypothetical protein [Clostridium botulinum]
MKMIGLYNGSVESLIEIIAKELSKRPKVRKITLTISSITTILLGIFVFVIRYKFNYNNISLMIPVILLAGSGLFLYISAVSYLINIKSKTVSAHLEELAKERQELNDKLQEDNNVMDVIKINLNQLNEYYTINQAQARKSYSFSVVMIIIGFIAIIVGIAFCYSGKTELSIGLIASASGLIAEFIGATSLVLYKENSKQAQLYFEKLSYLQHVMLSVELSDRLKDEKREDEISIIISALLNNKLKDTDKKIV